jgi:hypothetical protein
VPPFSTQEGKQWIFFILKITREKFMCGRGMKFIGPIINV